MTERIVLDPKSRFSAPNFYPQLLRGNGKSDIGSYADSILEKSSHLSAYRRRRLLFREMTAIHLDRAQESIWPNTTVKVQRIGQHVTQFMPIFIPWNKQSRSNELNDGPRPAFSLSLKNDQLVQKYSRCNKNQSVEVGRCHSLLRKATSSIVPESGIKKSFLSIKKPINHRA
jgi:hypothetical protein